MSQPLDKGRAVVIAEKYQTSQIDQQTGQPVMKNRYATVGRATMWPPNEGTGTTPKVDIEIDTLPVGHTGPIKIMVFWDTESKENQQPALQQDNGQSTQAQYQTPEQYNQQQGSKQPTQPSTYDNRRG